MNVRIRASRDDPKLVQNLHRPGEGGNAGCARQKRNERPADGIGIIMRTPWPLFRALYTVRAVIETVEQQPTGSGTQTCYGADDNVQEAVGVGVFRVTCLFHHADSIGTLCFTQSGVEPAV